VRGIVIGTSKSNKVSIDLKLLMSTRLLITADSGGGKTFAMKRIIEQAFGKVGIIVIDPEGEFSPLRTQFDFFLVGKGGDTPADIRTAEKVARTLLEGRASAICDIYEMKASERHIWVARFLDALIDAPKELRHPYLVIVDESHIFCPENGKGTSVADDSMKALATRGRKRMLCGVFATQRLATLSKDLTSMCLNRLIGPTFESVNQKAAVLQLGIPKDDEREFLAKIKMLEPGYFYALGRAITKELELVHIGPIETPHGEDALKYELKPPPPTEKVREWLAKLGDLPKQAEEEARTVADFKKQIGELKRDLSNATRNIQNSIQKKPVVDERTIARAVESAVVSAEAEIKKRDKIIATMREKIGSAVPFLTLAHDTASVIMNAPYKRISGENPKKERVLQNQGPALPREGTPTRAQHTRPIHPALAANARNYQRSIDNAVHTVDLPGGDASLALTGPETRILRALAELRSIGKETVPKAMCAAWSGYSPLGGAFGNPIGKLRTAGLIEYPAPSSVALTEAGLNAASDVDYPDQAEIRRRIEKICKGPERKILAVLLDNGDAEMSKDELAERSGYSPVGGAFGNPVGALRTKGLIDYPRPGVVRPSDWLFVS
jgi:uncharacterized protein